MRLIDHGKIHKVRPGCLREAIPERRDLQSLGGNKHKQRLAVADSVVKLLLLICLQPLP